MPRKRMIDPSFWRDEKIAECSHVERLMYIGMWNFAEDHGVGRANPKLIKADIFPYDTLRDSDMEKALNHLAELALIVLFEADSQNYYYIPNFKKHQTINKPTPPTLPLPDECSSATVVLPTEEKRKEENRKEYVDFFESVWKLYPKKEGKGQVSNTQKAKLQKIGYEHLERCIERYVAAKKDTDKKYWQNGSTFFNSGYVDYLDENFDIAGTEPTNGTRREDGKVYFDGKWVAV
ncbi:hypothetical protein LJC49_09800 [Ruminococcaceae bacterium OttesenSCG-928-I18]|nr:hypothetical protein [Ruminococcaceae bacterium OttesenSCG-928-I18]